MEIYEGQQNYIFISYAHRDAKTVLPIIEAMDKSGLRVWYDKGIEAGTEWPAYIEEHLENCACFVVFMSANTVESINCRNEINVAAEDKKDMLIVYLEETQLKYGLRLQLSSRQSLFRQRHSSNESFINELVTAKILKCCKRHPEEAELRTKSEAPSEPMTVSAQLTETDIPVQHESFSISEQEKKQELPSTISYDPDEFVIINEKLSRYKGNKKNVIIPYGVTAIEDRAFCECTSIKSVTLPDSITTIGNYSFQSCTDLESIDIPNSVTCIGSYAFHKCINLSSFSVAENNDAYASINGNLYTKDRKTLVQYAAKKTETSFAIPNDVTTVADSAFNECNNLTSITIPDSVTHIGFSAFMNCSNLKHVSLPNSLTAINSFAFSGCTGLISVTIPDSVTIIGNSVFSGCSSLTDVTVGCKVKRIGYKVFNSCKKLTNVTFKLTDTWYRTDNSAYILGQPTKMTNAKKNAKYFTSQYCDCYWYKA